MASSWLPSHTYPISTQCLCGQVDVITRQGHVCGVMWWWDVTSTGDRALGERKRKPRAHKMDLWPGSHFVNAGGLEIARGRTKAHQQEVFHCEKGWLSWLNIFICVISNNVQTCKIGQKSYVGDKKSYVGLIFLHICCGPGKLPYYDANNKQH